MDRRSFLKCVVAVPVMAAVSPLVAHREQSLHYRGLQYFVDPECYKGRMYLVGPMTIEFYPAT